MNSFTAKQKLFIDNYLVTLNGTEAARLAGYKGDDNVLGVIAYENLRKPKIKKEIEHRLSESALSANETLARVAQHATASLDDFLVIDDARDGVVRIDLERAKEAGKLGVIKKYKH